MKNIKNNRITNLFDLSIVKCIATVYIVFISAFISYLTSKVYYELLWPNERATVVIFMTVSILIPYFYMLFSGQSGLKTIVIYHFILIFTALTMVIPYEYRPYAAIVMLVTLFAGFSTGVVTNAGICGFAFFSMASEPEFFFTIIMLLTGTLGCIAIYKLNNGIYKYISGILLFAFNMILHGVFRIYCIETYLEYEKLSFIFIGSLGTLFSVIIYFAVEIIYKRFILNEASSLRLKQMVSDNYKPLKYLKTKAISIYYHSKEVADLAKRCAKEIGADENIAYAGGLYHDIGKVFGGDYVSKGVEFAKKNNFPREITEIIADHNIKYGVPKNKECAIVLMIDTGINAYNYMSSKGTLGNANVRDIYEKAITGRLLSGYLDKAGMTIEEFNKVLKVIVEAREQQNGN